MRAVTNKAVEGPIFVSGRKFPDLPHKAYTGEVSWFCEAANGARVVVTTPAATKRNEVENYLATLPEIEVENNG